MGTYSTATRHCANVIHIYTVDISTSSPCRPEADDVRAMQQQLSSLHVLLEQSTAEHESSLQQVVGERDRLAEEGGRLQTQLISSQEERAALPSREQLARWGL